MKREKELTDALEKTKAFLLAWANTPLKGNSVKNLPDCLRMQAGWIDGVIKGKT